MRTKLDLATLQVLCDATRLADNDTGNLQHVVRNQDVALCVWGNLTKNPRSVAQLTIVWKKIATTKQ